jgi:predicted Zn-dependent peptidase
LQVPPAGAGAGGAASATAGAAGTSGAGGAADASGASGGAGAPGSDGGTTSDAADATSDASVGDGGFDVVSLPNLVMWLDAAKGLVTTTIGGIQGVSIWRDQSPIHNSVTASGAAPQLVSNAVDGRPALLFVPSLARVFAQPQGTTLDLRTDEFLVEMVAAWTTTTSSAATLFQMYRPADDVMPFAIVEDATSHGVSAVEKAPPVTVNVTSASPNLDDGAFRLVGARRVGAAATATLIEMIKSLKSDDVSDFAMRYLTRDRARAVLVMPYGDDAPPPPGTAVGHALAEVERHAPLPPAAIGNLVSLRNLTAMKTVDFDNGMRVVLLPRPGAPVITASLVFPGGTAAAGLGVVAAAHEAMDSNWQDSPGDQGVSFSFSSDLDSTTATVRAGAGHLALALDMLSFATKSFDLEWQSEKFRTAKLPNWRRRDQFPSNRADRALWSTVWAGHPYGNRPTADQVAAVSKSEISNWRDRTLVPKNAALIIVGDLDLVEAETAARESFAGWNESPGPVAPPPPAMPRAPNPPSILIGGTSVIVTPRPGATQAEIHLACPLAPATGRQTAIYDVAERTFREWLRQRLREETGSTYGVSSTDYTLRGGATVIQVQANVDNRRLPFALQTMRAFWANIAEKGAEREDVLAARDDLARWWFIGFETSPGLARSIAWAWNLGWPLTWADDAARYTTSVLPDEVTAALRMCARNQTLALTGEEAVIRRAIADLKTALPPARDAASAVP